MRSPAGRAPGSHPRTGTRRSSCRIGDGAACLSAARRSSGCLRSFRERVVSDWHMPSLRSGDGGRHSQRGDVLLSRPGGHLRLAGALISLGQLENEMRRSGTGGRVEDCARCGKGTENGEARTLHSLGGSQRDQTRNNDNNNNKEEKDRESRRRRRRLVYLPDRRVTGAALLGPPFARYLLQLSIAWLRALARAVNGTPTIESARPDRG